MQGGGGTSEPGLETWIVPVGSYWKECLERSLPRPPWEAPSGRRCRGPEGL